MIVNIHEAKTNFSRLVARFQSGEKIIIAKNGKPILKFAPVDENKNDSRETGFLNCKIDMSSFNDPVDGFKEYQ